MRYAEVGLHAINWDLTLERRRVYGVTELAGCLGVLPGTVRQWLFRAKTWFAWGYLEGLPSPDDNVGGRPVWLAPTVTWWLGVHLMAHLFGLREEGERWAGAYAVEQARAEGMPPLVLAVAVSAAEAALAAPLALGGRAFAALKTGIPRLAIHWRWQSES